jgi:hypothetical protein
MTTKSVLFGARRGFLLIPMAGALAWFAPSPAARAVTPAPDGGYLGFNTAEGTDALFSLSTGTNNTAAGFEASFKTQPASTTRPPVHLRSSSTQPAAATPPTALVRSKSTQPTTTRPLADLRFGTTQPAAATSHWAKVLVSISPRETTISISTT